MPVHIVAGGQFGSEGKGAFTVSLMDRIRHISGIETPVLVRVAGPNAGHTAYDHAGNKWSLRQIPVGAIRNHNSPIVIGQQSEIDFQVLHQEIDALEAAGIPIEDRLLIDAQATVIALKHKKAELGISTGTTGKGIGGARAARLLREARRVVDQASQIPGEIAATDRYLRDCIERGDTVIIEGTQGYGLGSHAGYYPFCTSSNCRPVDFLAMAGIHPRHGTGIFPWLVYRTHPIRIAGNSGPLHKETSWEEIGQPAEYTTVTQKIRRVGQWDELLARAAWEAAGRGLAVLRFVDYMVDRDDTEAVHRYMHTMENRFAGVHVPLLYAGLGPSHGTWRPEGGWNA